MNSTFTSKSTYQASNLNTRRPKLGLLANKASLLVVLFALFAFLSHAQVISIGSPVDGIEGGTDASFVIALENGAVNNTGSAIFGSINYGGTATQMVDYSGPFTFSIPVGASSTVLTLPVIDDNTLECDETIIATISNPNTGVINIATDTALIIDNNCAQSTISIGSPVDGGEPSSNVSFVISLDGGVTNGTGAPITGDLTLSGTAIAPSDYTDVTMFSIPNGASFVTVEIVVEDDLIVEATETIIATISNPTFASIATATSTANIQDNDSTASIDEFNLNQINVTIYPNPINSLMHLVSENHMQNYSITDLNGRVMVKGKLDATDANVNIETLPKGSYFVIVEFDDGHSVSKKVLKR